MRCLAVVACLLLLLAGCATPRASGASARTLGDGAVVASVGGTVNPQPDSMFRGIGLGGHAGFDFGLVDGVDLGIRVLVGSHQGWTTPDCPGLGGELRAKIELAGGNESGDLTLALAPSAGLGRIKTESYALRAGLGDYVYEFTANAARFELPAMVSFGDEVAELVLRVGPEYRAYSSFRSVERFDPYGRDGSPHIAPYGELMFGARVALAVSVGRVTFVPEVGFAIVVQRVGDGPPLSSPYSETPILVRMSLFAG